MVFKVLICISLLQLITSSLGKNINVEVKLHIDLPPNEKTNEKAVEKGQLSDESNEIVHATDEVPPLLTNGPSADSKQSANATEEDLPSAFANVDGEFAKKIVELKKQALRILKLRGKNVNPDVKLEENADWDDIEIDQSLYENMKKGFDEEEKRLTSKNESDRMTAPNFNVIPYAKWTMPIKYTTKLMKDKAKVALIDKALNEISTKTGCIKFKKVASTSDPHIEYMEVKDLGAACASSPLGKKSGKNTVTVSNTCLTYGTYVHETLHSLGFHHTQARPDAEQHVQIHWDNIMDVAKFNFKMWPYALNDQGPYDFGSIMQYSPYAFAIDKTKPTITARITKDTMKGAAAMMGQRDEMSKEDVRVVKQIYCENDEPDKNADCIDKTPDCADFEQKGYCEKNSAYNDYMKKTCRFSCKFCEV